MVGKQRKKWYKKNSSKQKIEYYTVSSYNQGMGTIRKKAHKKYNLINKSDSEVYNILSTSSSVPHEGREYIKRVMKRKKLYSSM